jgi:hypothetical protein
MSSSIIVTMRPADATITTPMTTGRSCKLKTDAQCSGLCMKDTQVPGRGEDAEVTDSRPSPHPGAGRPLWPPGPVTHTNFLAHRAPCSFPDSGEHT